MAQPPYWGTEKGQIIDIIAHGVDDWEEIQLETGFDRDKLNQILSEMYVSGELYKNEKGAYRVDRELYHAYINHTEKAPRQQPQRKLSVNDALRNWLTLQRVDAPLDKDHFFLDGRFLNNFTQWLLDHADASIVVVNPFVKECDLSQQLIEAKAKNIDVRLLTRYPEPKAARMHEKLKKSGVAVTYDPDIHAKMVLVDGQVAVVSSMNFNTESSAGQSWETGIVTTDSRIIESIARAIDKEMKM